MINNPDKYKKKKKLDEDNKSFKYYNNEDLINLLIKKFSDLEQAILKGLNNGGVPFYNNDLNDQIADAIYNQLKSDLGIKININDNLRDNLNNTSMSNRSKRIRLKLDNKRKDDDNNIFNNDQKLSIEDLDKLIQMPHKINLSEYDISKSSSYISNDINKQEMFDNLNINISINKNINKKITFDEDDNSLSRGQIIDDSSNNKEKKLEKNRTGLDLLMVKHFNENLPEQIMLNNNDNISNIEGNYNNESFSNSFINDNNEIIDINNNNRLKMLQLYESKEYQNFKNNFINEINKNFNNNLNNNNIYNSLKLNRENNNNNINNIINKSKQIENNMKYLKNTVNKTINENEESNYSDSYNSKKNNKKNKNKNNDDGYLSPGEIPPSEDNESSN
jgi:hypothetical protein